MVNIPGQVNVSCVQKGRLELDAGFFDLGLFLRGLLALPAMYPLLLMVVMVVMVVVIMIMVEGMMEVVIMMLVITRLMRLIFFEYFLSARPCSKQLYLASVSLFRPET